MYIFIFLHQTTTFGVTCRCQTCCISLYSYIKPQLPAIADYLDPVVYLYIPTSNHNLLSAQKKPPTVVYLYIPTSNHNLSGKVVPLSSLYIFIFLHQTTTTYMVGHICFKLYIFIFLHQTTTFSCFISQMAGCISLYSYIKPQLYFILIFYFIVVYLYIPTSNHNLSVLSPGLTPLYIFIFLHQTTTARLYSLLLPCCISLYSYIKPQRGICPPPPYTVVYLYIPTSNHNFVTFLVYGSQLYIFIFLHQTTTNRVLGYPPVRLYIFIFLHQTTTAFCSCAIRMRCISLYSYIKPQLQLHQFL